MSDAKEPDQEADSTNEEASGGFNLKLAYSLLAFAIVAAICIALFIVLPFYHRH
jgi:hypothetical protein